jgi:predicted enzyme related to lactoylglutathione lyase
MNFKNAISWFEIPTINLYRAQQFYEAIFGIELIPMETESFKMCVFPIEDPMAGIGGCLINTDGFHKPSSTDGPLIYLNANPDVQIVLEKVEAAGGKIIVPKTKISPEYGYMGVFIDSEGNRIGLHSIPKL